MAEKSSLLAGLRKVLSPVIPSNKKPQFLADQEIYVYPVVVVLCR